MSSLRPRLRDPRTWTVLPAAAAVGSYGLGYLVWLLVGLDQGLDCSDTTYSCGGVVWSVLIGALFWVAAPLAAVAAVGLVTLIVRSVWSAYAKLRD
jgi:hypothetical protein